MSLADWVPALAPEAAAAALSAAWQHRASAGLQAAAVPLLCLESYKCAAPQAKSEGTTLVLELGLMAAAAAAQHTGAWEYCTEVSKAAGIPLVAVVVAQQWSPLAGKLRATHNRLR